MDKSDYVGTRFGGLSPSWGSVIFWGHVILNRNSQAFVWFSDFVDKNNEVDQLGLKQASRRRDACKVVQQRALIVFVSWKASSSLEPCRYVIDNTASTTDGHTSKWLASLIVAVVDTVQKNLDPGNCTCALKRIFRWYTSNAQRARRTFISGYKDYGLLSRFLMQALLCCVW